VAFAFTIKASPFWAVAFGVPGFAALFADFPGRAVLGVVALLVTIATRLGLISVACSHLVLAGVYERGDVLVQLAEPGVPYAGFYAQSAVDVVYHFE
jgi:hypothetical protein